MWTPNCALNLTLSQNKFAHTFTFTQGFDHGAHLSRRWTKPFALAYSVEVECLFADLVYFQTQFSRRHRVAMARSLRGCESNFVVVYLKIRCRVYGLGRRNVLRVPSNKYFDPSRCWCVLKGWLFRIIYACYVCHGINSIFTMHIVYNCFIYKYFRITFIIIMANTGATFCLYVVLVCVYIHAFR